MAVEVRGFAVMDNRVDDRGRFYDPVGALRDVVQNHLLQVLALVAMEPPAGASAQELQDKKAEVFRAMPAADPRRYVRGQYKGYLDVPGVAPESSTETFVAVQLEIDNWRWAGVPVFLRAGKALAQSATEVRLLLRPTPRLAFLPTPTQVDPNQIVLRIDPDAGLRLQVITRSGDSWRPVHLDMLFHQELGEPWEPYERSCTPRCSATIKYSPARTASNKPGASCSRCWITRQTPSPTSADRGDHGRLSRFAVIIDGNSPG
jgi:glucose-6-phosphate 1-dehydrogenase